MLYNTQLFCCIQENAKPEDKLLDSLINAKNINILYAGKISPEKNILFLVQIIVNMYAVIVVRRNINQDHSSLFEVPFLLLSPDFFK